MRKLVLVGLAGAIALTVASCSSDSGGDVASSPSPIASPVAKKPATTQPFGAKGAAPLVAQKPPAGDTIPGLIQSTNGDERAKQVQASIDGQKGKDPFAGLPPKVERSRTAASRQNVPTVSQLPTKPRSTTTAFNPRTPMPPGKGIPTIKTLPPLPSANLANAVEVSGVVMVGGVAQAIVKAPNEETSRYVRVGQRLSNGQVLVKRIEMNAGSDPIVILEENGVEVSRAVGTVAPTAKPA
ncbi:hypothetical protein [Stenomitos frigidus]|uniref:Pilus assembly protein PilP n=1 Tax=Stenomitos frigidus ULC18 TaxID=2107698 RepID=A0A2T1EA17_9CYAN|nr:hypothetical protein [Stenomitos frigidus]PSB29543.1 hypothetical protein C7B82_10995 [Stenomitos frigidus ULC18]